MKLPLELEQITRAWKSFEDDTLYIENVIGDKIIYNIKSKLFYFERPGTERVEIDRESVEAIFK